MPAFDVTFRMTFHSYDLSEQFPFIIILLPRNDNKHANEIFQPNILLAAIILFLLLLFFFKKVLNSLIFSSNSSHP